MDVQYLYNSEGEWIGFRKGRNVFNKESVWCGWLPWESEEVVDQHGEYLGTIHGGNRLYHFSDRREHDAPETPAYPEHPGYVGDPGMIGYEAMPPTAKDVWFSVEI
ncbi:MAG TPA: hypothetical protein VMI31_01425 [Fimbriimonadaceae bacterium]|nr:hypothetical protein [Fimbriimonadaceae bacterium]